MSGSGVQSAMRRRTRAPEDERRTINSNQNNINRQSNSDNTNNANNNGTAKMSVNQMLYYHDVKIKIIEDKFKSVTGQTIIPDKKSEKDNMAQLNNIKKEIEDGIEKKLSIINNNLNFILNALNESKIYTKKLEQELSELKSNNQTIISNLNNKLETQEFLDYKASALAETIETGINQGINIENNNDAIAYINEDNDNALDNAIDNGNDASENIDNISAFSYQDNISNIEENIEENKKENVENITLETSYTSEFNINLDANIENSSIVQS